jgi:hypothetical protein
MRSLLDEILDSTDGPTIVSEQHDTNQIDTGGGAAGVSKPDQRKIGWLLLWLDADAAGKRPPKRSRDIWGDEADDSE